MSLATAVVDELLYSTDLWINDDGEFDVKVMYDIAKSVEEEGEY
jgi:hypothetical protein